MPKNKEDETEIEQPWGSTTHFVRKSLNKEDNYLAFWNKKQVTWLAMLHSVIEATEQHCNIEIPWLRSLANNYMLFSKFKDGKMIKIAQRVAGGGMKGRMDFILSRIRRVRYGEEGTEIE